MTTIELLGGLQTYVELLSTLRGLEIQRNPGQQYISTVSLSYDTITLKLGVISERGERRSLAINYLTCEFTIDREKVFLSETFCENKEREKEIRDVIMDHTPTEGRAWKPVVLENIYSPQVIHYLTIADEIAREGYLCARGDDYRPGYYSKIIVADNEIELKQINRMNAKSLDHKEDYHMRDLEFYIPINPGNGKSIVHDHEIGQMGIDFSNHSSENNKHCGNKIREKIESEKLRFK